MFNNMPINLRKDILLLMIKKVRNKLNGNTYKKLSNQIKRVCKSNKVQAKRLLELYDALKIYGRIKTR
jgi:hypothetical protein